MHTDYKYQQCSWNTSRYLQIFGCIFFCLCAFVQINDPYMALWMTIYLIPAASSLATVINPLLSGHEWFQKVNVFLVLACFTLGLFKIVEVDVFSDESSSMLWNYLQHESGRDLGGLILIIIWTSTTHLHDSFGSFSMRFAPCFVLLVAISLWGFIYWNEEFRKSLPEHCKNTVYPDNSAKEDTGSFVK